MNKLKIGFAMCGSFCTFLNALDTLRSLAAAGHDITPIMSYNAYTTDTRFGNASYFISEIENITGKKIICTISDAEPIGPKRMTDILVIEPCTGNTLAKLANGISDTPVTLAAKSQLRNSRPVLIALATNDALANSAKNIGLLQNCKNIFFVPYGQDDSLAKPNSMIADFSKTSEAIFEALEGKQIQPVII